MIYPIICWNNISKYSSNSIILDINKIPIPEQWFIEQLIHMTNHLNIDTENEIGSRVSRIQIIKKILEKGEIFNINECETCSTLGMIPLKKVPNQYSYKNIGGKLLQKLVFVSNNVIMDTSQPIFDLDTDEVISILPKLDNRLYKTKPKINDDKKFKKTSLIRKLIDEISTKDRRSLAQRIIDNPVKNWDSWGKFEHKNFSSSLDSLFMMIFVSNLKDDLKALLTSKGNNLEFYLTLSNTIRPEILKGLIEKLEEEINKLNELILQSNIITISHFRDTIRGLFEKIKLLSEPYYKYQNFHPISLIKDLFKIFGVDNTECTRLTRYYIEDVLESNFSGTNNELYPISAVENIIKEENTEHFSNNIIFNINDNLLKYLNTRNDHVMNYKELVEHRPRDIIFCSKCNEYIYNDTISTSKHKAFHKTNKVNIQELLDVQIDINSSDKPIWLLHDDWIRKNVAGVNLFYERKNEGNSELYISEYDVLLIEPPVAQKITRIIERLTIYNTNIIFFNFNRTDGRFNKSTALWENDYYDDLKMIPDEIITDIQDNEYALEAIITNKNNLYLLFLKNNTSWLVYNSAFNVETTSDYIEELGNYDNLLIYNNKHIQKYGIIYVYKLKSN